MQSIAYLFWAAVLAAMAVALWDCARWPRQTMAAWHRFRPVLIAVVAGASLFFLVNLVRFRGAEMGQLLRLALRLVVGGLGASIFFCAGWPWVTRAGHMGLFERAQRRRAGLSTPSVRRAVGETLAIAVAIPCFSAAFFALIKVLVEVQRSANFRQLFESPESLEARSGYLLLFIVAAPLWEETFFRWYLLNRFEELLARWSWGHWVAILGSSAVWALGHATLTVPFGVKVVQIFAIGCLLAWRFPVIGLSGCIVAHLAMNLLAVFSLALPG